MSYGSVISVIFQKIWNAIYSMGLMEHFRNRLTHLQDIAVNNRFQRLHAWSISISAKPCVGVVVPEADSSRSVPFAAWTRSFKKPLK